MINLCVIEGIVIVEWINTFFVIQFIFFYKYHSITICIYNLMILEIAAQCEWSIL